MRHRIYDTNEEDKITLIFYWVYAIICVNFTERGKHMKIRKYVVRSYMKAIQYFDTNRRRV